MDLKFVESLVAVVDHGSVASAAKHVNVTPAAISQRILALEAELKVPLLVRNGRAMAATPECLSLLPNLRQMLCLRAGLKAALAQDQLRGSLRLGAISTLLGEYGPNVVRHLRDAAPDVDLGLFPGASQDLFAKFEQGHLDVVLSVAPPFELPKTMFFQALSRQPIGVLARSDLHRDAPFIVYSRETWGGAVCWKALQDAFGTPEILCEMDAIETISQLVRDGLGRAVLPMWAGLSGLDGGLTFTALPAARDVGLLCWRKEAARPLFAILREALGLVD